MRRRTAASKFDPDTAIWGRVFQKALCRRLSAHPLRFVIHLSLAFVVS